MHITDHEKDIINRSILAADTFGLGRMVAQFVLAGSQSQTLGCDAYYPGFNLTRA